MDNIIYWIIRLFKEFGIVALFVVFWFITHTFFHELGHGIAIKLFSKDRIIMVIGSCSNTIKGKYILKIKLFKAIFYISKFKIKDMHLGRTFSSSNYQNFTPSQIRIIALSGLIGQSLYIILISTIFYLFNSKDKIWLLLIICFSFSILSWVFSPDRKNFFNPQDFKLNYRKKCIKNSEFDYNAYINLKKYKKKDEFNINNHNMILKLIKKKLIKSIIFSSVFLFILFIPVLMTYYKVLPNQNHKYLFIVVIVFFVVLLLTIILTVHKYNIDKKSNLIVLNVKLDLLNKSGSSNEEKYKLFKSYSKYDLLDIKAKVKANMGNEFILPVVLTVLTITLTITSFNKESISYTQEDYEQAIKIVSQESNYYTDEEFFDRVGELLESMKKDHIRGYLQVIGFIFIFGLLSLLLLASKLILENGKQKYILTFIEHIEKEN